jgi:hypothetical protein
MDSRRTDRHAIAIAIAIAIAEVMDGFEPRFREESRSAPFPAEALRRVSSS